MIGTTIAAAGSPDPTGPIINKLTKLLASTHNVISSKVTGCWKNLITKQNYLVLLCVTQTFPKVHFHHTGLR